MSRLVRFEGQPRLSTMTLPSLGSARRQPFRHFRRGLAPQRHHIGLARARDDEAQPPQLGMALADLGDLLGPHEHTLDLGGLISAGHLAPDAHVGASAGARPGQRGGEVLDREAYPAVMEVERGDDDFADLRDGSTSPFAVALTLRAIACRRSLQRQPMICQPVRIVRSAGIAGKSSFTIRPIDRLLVFLRKRLQRRHCGFAD
jgi:hypothetical protein